MGPCRRLSYRELGRLLEAGMLLALVKVQQMPVEVVQKIDLHSITTLISISTHHHPGWFCRCADGDRVDDIDIYGCNIFVYQYFVE